MFTFNTAVQIVEAAVNSLLLVISEREAGMHYQYMFQ